MATTEQVVEAIDDAAEKLAALHAVHSSPELTALHASLDSARSLAIEHFEIEDTAARGGGHDKPPEDPDGPPG